MRIAEQSFRGEQPRISPVKLGEGLSQIASCCRLLSGDLEPWRNYGLELDPTKVGTINSIHLMDGLYWLHWVTSELGAGQAAVDVVLGAVPADVTERTYFTGTDVPRVTNINKATTGGGTNYPIASLKLGVPVPTVDPTAAAVGSSSSTASVTLTNPGAESGNTTGWTSTTGTLVVETTTPSPHSGTYYFGPTAADATTEAYHRVTLDTASVIVGQKLALKWWQASGSLAGKARMRMRFRSAALADLGVVDATMQAVTPADTWSQRTLEATVPADAEYVDLIQGYEKVGANSDGYIDDITLTATSQAVTFGDTLSGWQFTPYATDGATYTQQVVIEPTIGQPAPSIRMVNDSRHVFLWRDFALDLSPSFRIEYDCYAEYDLHCFVGTERSGVYDPNCSSIGISINGAQHYRNGAVVTQLYASGLGGTWVRVVITGTRIDADTVRLTVTITNKGTGAVLVNAVAFDAETTGKYLQFWCSGPDAFVSSYIDNGLILVDPPVESEETSATSYVYTFINEFGEESAPSDPTDTILRGPNTAVTITTPTTATAGHGITHKRIYRAVTSDSGTQFQLVNTEGDILLATATYEDQKDDAQLGEVLESEGWDLPPTDGHNIVAGANGITAMLSKNQWCPSVANRPHAWPEDYRLTMDYDAVAQGVVDTSFIVGTKGGPYIVQGSDPSAMAMSSKPEIPQGCMSRRSGATMAGLGWLYAGPDGLVAVAGPGQARIATEAYISPKEWKALNPASIIGAAHDDRYFGFYDAGGGVTGGFIFDPKPGGLGWVRLNFYAKAMFVDAERDALFVVVSDIIYEWDKSSSAFRAYQWKSKRYLLSRKAVFTICQISAETFTALTLKLYANGTLFHTQAVTSGDEFRIPAPQSGGKDVPYDDFEFELSGTDVVQDIQFVEDVRELV